MCFCDNFILHIRPTTLTCSISRIILAVAPTIIYSALLSKTLRIILIFYGKLILTLQVSYAWQMTSVKKFIKFLLNLSFNILLLKIRKYLSSKFQVLSTFLLSSIQIIIAIVWLGFDPPQALAIYPDYHSGFLVCSDYQDFRVLVALVYPFILIAACTVAATMNRNVPAGFNEARHIGNFWWIHRHFLHVHLPPHFQRECYHTPGWWAYGLSMFKKVIWVDWCWRSV